MTSANTSATPAPATSPNSESDSRAAALVTMMRLHWFIRLRWVFLAAAVAVLVAERLLNADAERPLGLAVVLFALVAVNLLWVAVSHFLFRQFHEDAAPLRGQLRRVVVFANAQVAMDLFLLTCILRFTGGVENPIAIFYLFHMAITALLLKRWQALLQGVWAILLYAGLVIGEWQRWLTPHWGFLPTHAFGLYAEVEFVVANLIVVVCGILGTLYFTLHIAKRLETRERQLREANAALRRSQTAIQDLQRRRSRFMQTAAHQLKSPLAVIQTLTDLIRNQIVPPEGVGETCDKIVRRCREGIEQVRELLTLARVQEADPARHGRAEVDVRQVVEELCDRFQPLATEKGIELSRRLPEEGELRVSVDRQDLVDCVGNLIENAIKYTPDKGRISVSVAVDSAPQRPGGVSVDVTDTGIGVDPTILKAADGEPGHEPVFEAFRRGNNVLAAGIPGTGLGLSIVREIVEQAGGRIRVTSRPNEGSSFTVTFPRPRESPDRPRGRDTRVSQVVVESGESDDSRRPPDSRGSPADEGTTD